MESLIFDTNGLAVQRPADCIFMEVTQRASCEDGKRIPANPAIRHEQAALCSAFHAQRHDAATDPQFPLRAVHLQY
jgi:hypothetical protein